MPVEVWAVLELDLLSLAIQMQESRETENL
jgi:hypothetical protein